MSKEKPRRKSRHFSPREKRDAVLRLLKGEKTGAVAEDIGVGVNRLERWQERFLDGGTAALEKAHERHGSIFGSLKTHSAAVTQWAGLLVVLTVVVFFLVRYLT